MSKTLNTIVVIAVLVVLGLQAAASIQVSQALSEVVGGNESQPAVGGPMRLQNSGIQANSNNRDFDHFLAGSSDSELFYIDSGNDRVGISTSSPDQIFHVDGGASATTTIQIGSGANASSKTCFNLNDDSGNVKSAYIVGTSWVIESGACN